MQPKSNKPHKTKENPDRLEARVSAEQKEKFKLAAYLRGISLTDFIIHTANEAADKVISDNNTVQLSIRESQQFYDALTNAPAPNTALLNASKKYRQFKKS